MNPLHRLSLALLLVVIELGCVKTRIDSLTATSLTGGSAPAPPTLRINGQDYPVGVCRSGGREYFLGVDLEDEASGTLLRLHFDPMEGPRLRVVHGGGNGQKTVVFTRNSCRQLDARIEDTGWRVNRVRDFSGSLDADCASQDGLDVQAHITFTHCH